MIENSPALLLTAAETAEALALSRRTLWTLTDRKEIPCVRIGRAVRYDPADLRAWIASRKAETMQDRLDARPPCSPS
jgi:excisionase family DNA binding protein